MHKFRSLIYFIMAFANIALSIPLSRLYGGVGAAIGTAMSVVVGNGLIMNWYYEKKIGIDIKYFWNQIASFTPAFVIPVIFGILINWQLDLYQTRIFIIAGILYIIVFALSMWHFGLNQFEKDLLQPMKRFFKKYKGFKS